MKGGITLFFARISGKVWATAHLSSALLSGLGGSYPSRSRFKKGVTAENAGKRQEGFQYRVFSRL